MAFSASMPIQPLNAAHAHSPDPDPHTTVRIDVGREVCGRLAVAESREWLVTNGIGGYAAGTIAGLHTRRYHGLLIAALAPPLGRTLLVSKVDETATYDGHAYHLAANRWASGAVDPQGFHYLERFHLEGTTPVWTFACADALLEKRVWMQQGANTTYVQYQLSRASAPLTLEIDALVNYRDYHGATHAGDWLRRVEPVARGLRITAFDGATPYYLLTDRAAATPRHDWYRDFSLSVEMYRGLDDREDHLCAGRFTVTLPPGEARTLVATTNAAPGLDGPSALASQQAYTHRLLAVNGVPRGQAEAPVAVQQLVLAADQFLVRRPEAGVNGQTVIAGYPWFADWGRDTMVSLPGLTLDTRRPHIARRILSTFAQYVDQGMLPNRFPDAGDPPDYNTVDAALWYVEAIRAYHAATGDDDLLLELVPVLQGIVAWHERGTGYQIHMDPADGLLYAGEEGVQLAWMDAKVGAWVVTPRIGKPVEVNALWYNALRTVAAFARRLGQDASAYDRRADRVAQSFGRFWNARRGYCYDVIDGAAGDDASLRPNQLLAVSLAHSPLPADQQRAVVDVCARHLLTSHGLRSLAPDDLAYAGHYGGGQRQRDGAYHQGTVWAWLSRDRRAAWPLRHHPRGHGVQPDRLRGGAGPGQERRLDPGQRDRR